MKECLAEIRRNLIPGPKDALVRLSVLKIKEQGLTRSRTLRVTHEPNKKCPAYSAIRGLPIVSDDQLCALLAQLAVTEIKQVRDI